MMGLGHAGRGAGVVGGRFCIASGPAVVACANGLGHWVAWQASRLDRAAPMVGRERAAAVPRLTQGQRW